MLEGLGWGVLALFSPYNRSGPTPPAPHLCLATASAFPCHVFLPPQLGFFPSCNTIPGPGPSLSLLAAPHPPPSPCAIALPALRAQGRAQPARGGGWGWFWGSCPALEVQQLLWERDQNHRTVARTNYSNELPPVNEPRAAKGTQGKIHRGKNPQGKKPMGEKHPQRKKKIKKPWGEENPQRCHRVSSIPKTWPGPSHASVTPN